MLFGAAYGAAVLGKAQIGRSEVMTPFTYAVRLIYGYNGNEVFSRVVLYAIYEALYLKSLGR